MHLPESEPKTIQRVASRYTDYPSSHQMSDIRTRTLLKNNLLREVSFTVLHHLTKILFENQPLFCNHQILCTAIKCR